MDNEYDDITYGNSLAASSTTLKGRGIRFHADSGCEEGQGGVML